MDFKSRIYAKYLKCLIFFGICYQFYAPSNFYGHIRGGATWTILRAATQECKM